MKYSLEDYSIVPATLSTINSRSECKLTNSQGVLPIIVAPMDTVTSKENLNFLLAENIQVATPRGLNVKHNNLTIESISLQELHDIVELENLSIPHNYHHRILVDIANGHMVYVLDLIQKLKSINPKYFVIAGNIANPQSIVEYAKRGIDAVRIGIGSGSACTTTSHTNVHFPMGDLIKECKNIANQCENPPMIIADGGMRSTANINTALALGADYVMVGSLFSQCIESCGSNYLFNKVKIPQDLAEVFFKWGLPVYKEYRGMSTIAVQKSWGNKILKRSEGIHNRNRVKWIIKDLVDNIKFRLSSAMSYTSCKTIEEFTSSNVSLVLKSNNTTNNINKV